MKKFSCLIPVLFLVLSVFAEAFAQNDSSLMNENLFLNSELSLAKKPNIYFIFDLKNNEVLLKARGLVLKKMKIKHMKFWGSYIDTTPRAMLKKSALFKEPKRINIDPIKAKEEETAPAPATTTTPGAYEVEALELKDMPTIYYLEFHEGIFISVRPASASAFTSKLYAAANYTGWLISRPLLTIWNTFKGRPFTSIYLEMSEEDARSIYWALVENSENIIYKP